MKQSQRNGILRGVGTCLFLAMCGNMPTTALSITDVRESGRRTQIAGVAGSLLVAAPSPGAMSQRTGRCQGRFAISGDFPDEPWANTTLYGNGDETDCPGTSDPLNLAVCKDFEDAVLPAEGDVKNWVEDLLPGIPLIDSKGHYCELARWVAPSAGTNDDCVIVGLAWGCRRGQGSY